ncbi:MAG: TrkH family potassium uptake protein [Eubacteriales bacterium]|nr:TrkH family potassium uptake protein [Eubacteriales bacterium]
MYRIGRHFHITSFQIIIMGFLAIIITGSLLLMLPAAAVDGSATAPIDAVFTAVSAVCVTGLVVHDTGTYWSLFGQTVILVLIQIGGMGVITIAVAAAAASGKKISLMQRRIMQESISAPQLGGIVRMTRFILKTGLVLELSGAVMLSLVFVRQYGGRKGIWYALFHAISAFCNAGFDLNGIREPFSSLTAYAGQPIVNLTVMFLIVAGGIGFLTWDDIWRNRYHFRKYRMQSKVIFTVTAVLIAVPALYFFFFELGDVPKEKRIWEALFQAVTPRTAGFNTADLSKISDTGLMMTILLMLIGGSPGSTAGGMKTTTAAVLIASVAAVFKKKSSANLFGRRIPDDAVRTAAALFFTYVVLFIGGGMIISSMEGVPLLTCMFETASAIGTVGLSLGLTPQLCSASKMILIVLMFFGRVGCLTLVFAAFAEKKNVNAKLPQERITVG